MPLFTSLPEILAMGRSVFDPIWAEREHTDRSSELMHVLQGRVAVRTRDYEIVGRAGDTIYTPAGVPHRDVFPPGSVFEVYLVQFRWPGEAKLLKRFSPPQLARVRPPGRVALADACHRLYREFQSSMPEHQTLASLLLAQIISQLCREATLADVGHRGSGASGASEDAGKPGKSQSGRGRRGQIMARARQLIHEHYARPLSLDWLSEQLDVSPYYLSRVFSAESGFRLSDYLTSVRLAAARGLLADGSAPIAEIARAVGYRDAHYFAKVFKRAFGQSPSRFRHGTATT